MVVSVKPPGKLRHSWVDNGAAVSSNRTTTAPVDKSKAVKAESIKSDTSIPKGKEAFSGGKIGAKWAPRNSIKESTKSDEGEPKNASRQLSKSESEPVSTQDKSFKVALKKVETEPKFVEKEKVVAAYQIPLKRVSLTPQVSDNGTKEQSQSVPTAQITKTSHHEEKPTFKVELKKVQTQPRHIIPPSEKEVEAYKIELKRVEPEMMMSSYDASNKNETAYNVDLKRVEMEAGTSSSFDKGTVLYDVELKKTASTEDASTSTTSIDTGGSIVTERIDASQSTLKTKTLYNTMDLKTVPGVSKSTATKSAAPYAVQLKKVGLPDKKESSKDMPAGSGHEKSIPTKLVPPESSGRLGNSLDRKATSTAGEVDHMVNGKAKDSWSDPMLSEEKEPTYHKKKEEEELQLLRARGLTRALTSKDVTKVSEFSSSNHGKADQELQELRALGLTKALSSRNVASSSASMGKVVKSHTHTGEQSNKQILSSSTVDDSLPTKGVEPVKSLGTNRTTALKDRSTPVEAQAGQQNSSQRASKTEEELKDLRSRGLMTALSSRSISNGGTAQPNAMKLPHKNEEADATVNGSDPVSKELQELKALGLTKEISKKNFTTGGDRPTSTEVGVPGQNVGHKQFASEKDMAELQNLRAAKKVSQSESTDSKGKPTNPSGAEKELAELRALGRTSSLSQRGFNEATSKTAGNNWQGHPKAHASLGDLDAEAEDIIYEDSSSDFDYTNEHQMGTILPPSVSDEDNNLAPEPPGGANDSGDEEFEHRNVQSDNRERSKSKSTFSPEEKAELRRLRQDNKKFKGMKRFVFGKKQSKMMA